MGAPADDALSLHIAGTHQTSADLAFSMKAGMWVGS